ncbi:MAG: hypothetical protein ACKO5E_07885 [bacterium]
MESLARTVVLLVLVSTIAGGLIGAGLGLVASDFFEIPKTGGVLLGLIAGSLIGFFLLPFIAGWS